MRCLQVVNHLSDSKVQAKLSDSRGIPSHNRWQIINLVQVGNILAAELLAPLVNLSVHSIYKIVESYNRSGVTATIHIVDESGKLISTLNAKSYKIDIDLSAKPAGIYYLRIVDDGKTITKKVIKQ